MCLKQTNVHQVFPQRWPHKSYPAHIYQLQADRALLLLQAVVLTEYVCLYGEEGVFVFASIFCHSQQREKGVMSFLAVWSPAT